MICRRSFIRSCCSPSSNSSTGRLPSFTALVFGIVFLAVANSFPAGSFPRALATGCCGSLFGILESSVDFSFSSERKNRTYRLRMRPLSRSSPPSPLRVYCDSTFFVSSSYTGLMVWKNPRWSFMPICFSNSITWRSKKQNTAALYTLFSQLHACLATLWSCASLVFIFKC